MKASHRSGNSAPSQNEENNNENINYLNKGVNLTLISEENSADEFGSSFSNQLNQSNPSNE